ncbi:MAG: hypothetical protein GC171_13040 [Terrimonas sp.]|nr:hypothetical protein [Terrimonas sp.]
MKTVLRKLNKLFSSAVDEMPPAATPVPQELVSEFVYNNYSFVISGYINYFNELDAEHKRRFVDRVHHYRMSKTFHYVGLEEKEEIPILVSASAVQVTFGLENYMMENFKDIHILADAYHMDSDKELYIGHVAPEGIYLSWKHFLYGYAVSNDNINVALHEMSHALLHNNFFAQYGNDKEFRLNYERFSTTTGPILADVITRRRSYLRSYAYSNIHEFWAVSVEAFFESPEGLKMNMPQLYEALCKVLNQDPISPNKIIH